MKFKNTKVTGITNNILFNDHFVNINYDCSGLSSLAKDGVIPAGTVIPSNDSNAIGVLFSDVDIDGNPNGTVIIHGFINQAKLPEAVSSAAVSALKGIMFMDKQGKPQPQKYTVTYDANGGTGEVTDSSSPYTYGTSVTVQAGSGLTPPDSKTFKGWALTPDAGVKDDNYDPSDTFTITDNITLYAVYE